VFSITDR